MKAIQFNQTALPQAIKALKQGRLVIYPTETCYGAAADATNLKAVAKLLAYKGNRGRKPISIACADQKMAAKYVRLNDTARQLYKNFLPGPVTVVSQSRGRTAPNLEAGTSTLGIRIPDYPPILKLIKQFGRPITATSANTSSQKQPYSLIDWQKYTSAKKQKMIGLFLDAGRLVKREPSTVVDTTFNEAKILRQGEIKIKNAAGRTLISRSEAETQKTAQRLLGRWAKHSSEVLRPPCLIFALQGELGSGKTQFAKGLAKGLGIKANVTSPTYTIIHEHPFKTGVLYHIDTWRLNKGEELLELGLEKMIQPGNVIALEWLQKVKNILEKLDAKIIWLTIETLSPTKRKIKYQFKSKPSPARRGNK